MKKPTTISKESVSEYRVIRAPQLDRSPVYRDHACMISSLVRARPLAQPQTQTLSY